MSRENVEIVERFEALMGARGGEDEAANRRRFEEILSLLDEGVAFRPSDSVPGHGGDWIGHDGFLGMCRAYGTVWEPPKDFRVECLDGGGDRVVILAEFTRTARATGRSIPIRMVEIVTVRNGRIVELVPYFHDTVAMREAVGLAASPEP